MRTVVVGSTDRAPPASHGQGMTTWSSCGRANGHDVQAAER